MEGVVKRQCSDTISNLPEDVIGAILVNLPTRDAIRTSILSKKWRHRWAKLPQLILDESVQNAKCSTRTMVAMILGQYVLLHEGPIKKFTLSIPGLESSEMNKLMVFLSRYGIEDLTLDVRNWRYKWRMSFPSCQQLRHLNLRFCLLKATLDFRGFSRLTSLKLGQVIITSKELERLISGCPLLELLDLQDCYLGTSDTAIEIDAPSLKTFSFRGTPKLIVFTKVPRLASVSISPIYWTPKNFLRQNGACRLNDFFHCLPVLEKLHLAFGQDKCLVAGEVPKRLPTTLVNLKHLRLQKMKSYDQDYLSFVFCLIRSSPYLKHIDIEFRNDEIPSHVQPFIEDQNCPAVMLNELEQVQLTGVTGASHLFLILVLLKISPSLKKMRVENKLGLETERGSALFKTLAEFPSASKQAEVIYVDSHKQLICSVKKLPIVFGR